MRSLTSLATAATCLALVASPVLAAPQCIAVKGHYDEFPVTGPDCLSPIGLCTVAVLSGEVKGDARYTATMLTPTPDTPATGVVIITGDTVVSNVKLQNRRGTINIKNAAAVRSTGAGDVVDLQVITGGTGDFTGATGALRVTGSLVGTEGSSTFDGSVCLP